MCVIDLGGHKQTSRDITTHNMLAITMVLLRGQGISLYVYNISITQITASRRDACLEVRFLYKSRERHTFLSVSRIKLITPALERYFIHCDGVVFIQTRA